MAFGDVEIVREGENIRLLKIECKYNNFSYCVLGNGPTRHFDDYDDALEDERKVWQINVRKCINSIKLNIIELSKWILYL